MLIRSQAVSETTDAVTFALASLACLASASCDSPQALRPTESRSTEMALNNVGSPAAPANMGQETAQDRVSNSVDEERKMPEPTTKPPAPKRPSSPDREYKPAPLQPPAEVDPPHRDPGDEVPQ